jgi:lipid-A-disaccharide synthase-like uncharacterized protein
MTRWLSSAMIALALQSATLARTDEATVIDLGQRIGDVQTVQSDGQLRLIVPTDAGPREVRPEQFALMLQWSRQEQQRHGFLFVLFNITSWTGVAWVALGLGGQLAFTLRMLVQWLSSERARRSVVPVSFWWMSLAGATMLILYFIWRKDLVGVIGQSTGWIIYIRNLRLVYKHRPEPTIADDPGPEPELAQ